MSNKLRIYQENFESSYVEAARDYYASHAPAYLTENGVQNYMKYVSTNMCTQQKLFRMQNFPI